MPGPDEIQAQLEALKTEFATSLGTRVGAAISALDALTSQPDPVAGLQSLFRKLHSLSGSAGTFGFNRLSEQARQVELILKSSMNSQSLPDASTMDYLKYGLNKLLMLSSEGPDQVKPTERPQQAEVTENKDRLIYVVEDDPLQGHELCLQLEHYGFHTRLFTTSTEAMQALQNILPDALVLDIVLPEGQLAGTEFATTAGRLNHTPIPTVFISSSKDWDTRLAAVRAGGAAYLDKPVDISILVDHLDRITQRVQHEPYHVLVIDDAAELAQHYALALRKAGMFAEIVSEPSALLEKMENFRPELILLDYYFPDITGMEIAQVLRQHITWFSTPIVFLSTELEREIQLKTLKQGDDFLEKPINDTHLVNVVSSRIERARALRKLMYHDGLTGLLNQITLKRRLETELTRSVRLNTPITYIMLDLDHFKQINDKHGHTTGDRVIKSLALLLKERLRKSDHIGRYGGEEFGIIMPDTDAQTAHHILDDLRIRFSQLTFLNDGREFSSSFSAGIACASAYSQEKHLIEAADEALYLAKDRGRNQVVLHKECPA